MNSTKNLRTYALAAAVSLLAVACEKPKNVAPAADKEFDSTVDISYAAQVISDVDMICSFVGENDQLPKFYTEAPGETPALITRDIQNDYLFMSFNNSKCMDGRLRQGTVAMSYAYTNPNAKYYRDYQFEGKVSLSNYRVDGWRIGLNNDFKITNNLASPGYDPKTTKLSWTLNGDFTLQHPTDPSKNMHCNVNLVKTLANSTDPAVFPVSKQSMINWSLAVVEYRGTIFGETAGNVPFTYEINEKNPLVRDFSCYPDKVAGIGGGPSYKPWFEEFHPFTKGLATFKTGELYPRLISYGNEQDIYGDVKNSPMKLTPQCDNEGIVTIKGISYPVNFRK